MQPLEQHNARSPCPSPTPSLLKLMSIELVMISHHLILCYPLLLPPSIFPSNRIFSNESVLHIRWPKHWSFSFNISPSNEHPGLISFRMNYMDLLAVQGTLKSLLQHHSSKASIQGSAFFIVQLSYPYMATGKTIDLTTWTFVGKVVLLLFFFNWRLITLQYCGGFCYTFTWISHGCACVTHSEPPSHHPPHPIPQGHPSAPVLSTLFQALNQDWRSISHMIIYIFQCYYLKIYHTLLHPLSAKVCSLHLCLFCCHAYGIIITIFLNFIYMC